MRWTVLCVALVVSGCLGGQDPPDEERPEQDPAPQAPPQEASDEGRRVGSFTWLGQTYNWSDWDQDGIGDSTTLTLQTQIDDTSLLLALHDDRRGDLVLETQDRTLTLPQAQLLALRLDAGEEARMTLVFGSA